MYFHSGLSGSFGGDYTTGRRRIATILGGWTGELRRVSSDIESIFNWLPESETDLSTNVPSSFSEHKDFDRIVDIDPDSREDCSPHDAQLVELNELYELVLEVAESSVSSETASPHPGFGFEVSDDHSFYGESKSSSKSSLRWVNLLSNLSISNTLLPEEVFGCEHNEADRFIDTNYSSDIDDAIEGPKDTVPPHKTSFHADHERQAIAEHLFQSYIRLWFPYHQTEIAVTTIWCMGFLPTKTHKMLNTSTLRVPLRRVLEKMSSNSLTYRNVDYTIIISSTSSQIRCLAHVVTLTVWKTLATLNEADDPEMVDYYLPSKDFPFHYDPDNDLDLRDPEKRRSRTRGMCIVRGSLMSSGLAIRFRASGRTFCYVFLASLDG
ncbi:hypothetical protein B0H14DRAFT_2599019 [Mycena olivaceomarginata]|nr:hypothetical protein B0H14DRAFT_2599019 [Mycena olivaceomarginata]